MYRGQKQGQVTREECRDCPSIQETETQMKLDLAKDVQDKGTSKYISDEKNEKTTVENMGPLLSRMGYLVTQDKERLRY